MVAELEKEILASFFLLELEFTTTYYYTDRDIPVHYDGHHYEPLGFSFTDIAYSGSMAVDSVTVDIVNLDRVFSGIILNEDVRNKTANIHFGVTLRTNGRISSTIVEPVFVGKIAGWKIEGDKKCSLTIANEMILWNKKTLRTHPANCPWTFKGTECAYAGAVTTCDKSWDACVAMVNEANYGGFRWIPKLVDKETWWGKTQGGKD
ncbi:MAG: hypothetical protein A4E65_02319 [Syntrophorhabdus sp. PtaU1.Bin153]|nr:MAG: hypothetical protein A4E65_02319 [Syntrophorhabdus sp. PtaU1.Bin153]